MSASSWLNEVAAQIIAFANSISGLVSFAAIVAAMVAYLLPWVLPSPLRSLVGTWWSYGYFYHRHSDPTRQALFYKERTVIKHFWLWPWVLSVTSYPQSEDGKPTTLRYRGFCWYRSIYVYFQGYEPIYDDTTFEIYRRVMDERHTDDFLVGTHLGKSYDDMVFQASITLLSRNELLASDPSLAEADRLEEEMKIFHEITKEFAEHDQARGMLLVK